MRGQVFFHSFILVILGITPADAGTSFLRDRCRHFRKDHPRGCGDKAGMVVLVFTLRGSPPRMRGQADHFARF